MFDAPVARRSGEGGTDMTRRRSTWIHRVEAVVAVALVAVVVVALVRRSTPSKATQAGSTVTTTAGSAPASPAVTAGPAPASGHLPQLQAKASSAMHATFKATYLAKGASTTIVFARKGSKTSFSTGTTAYYSDGATNTVCDSSSGAPSCYTAATPLSGLLSLMNPAQESSAIQAANAAGLSVDYSTATHDGQLSSCISYSKAGQRVKYCINDHGILTYIKIPTGAFELTSYTTAVSDADVSVPANATIRPAPSTP